MSEIEFLGMPVEGDIYKESQGVEQFPVAHLQSTMERVLSHPEVLGIMWDQYTPYYNDGDPCTFRVGEANYLFEGATPQDRDYFDYSWQEDEAEEGRFWVGEWSNREEFQRIVGSTEKEYSGTYPNRQWKYKIDPATAPNPALFTDVTEFMMLIKTGHYDNALRGLFGDHVTVKIDKVASKVYLESYEHD